MAREAGRSHRLRQMTAVMLLLCSLAPCLPCFGFGVLGEEVKQGKKMGVRPGRILFNGKDLNSQSEIGTAVTRNNGSLSIDSPQADDAGNPVHILTGQLNDAMSSDEAWRRLDTTLQCGGDQMKLKAMGPGASYLQLDMGTAPPMPLTQVLQSCGYSMQRNSLGLILVIAYNGCDMIQENGNYVLPMHWQGVSVKLTCPMLTAPAAVPALTTPVLVQKPWNPPSYQPQQPYFPFPYTIPVKATPPATTKLTTEPTTTTKKPLPPVYPQQPYFPYYPNFPYTIPVKATPPATTKLTTEPTTTTKKPLPPVYPQQPYFPYFPNFPYTIPVKATPPAKLTTKPQKPLYSYYWPFYPTQFPDGKPMKTTTPSTTLTSVKPTVTTTKPTTATSTKTTKSNDYPCPKNSFVPQLQFPPYDLYKKGVKGQDYQKYFPQENYKFGPPSQAHPRSFYNYWQAVPRSPHSTSQEDLSQANWDSLDSQ